MFEMSQRKQSPKLFRQALSINVFALSLLFITTNASAQRNQTENKQEDTITVTGNWLDSNNTEDILINHPGAISVITQKQFYQRGSSTVSDALKAVPGVQVRDNNGTGGSDVSLNLGLRGLATRLSPRSTILMDGIPISVAPYGQPQLSMAPVSLGNLSQIDIIRGAGAVRYGPQNVGGIINFVTKPIPEKFSANLNSQAQMSRYGGAKTLTSVSLGGSMENGFGAEILYSGLHGEGYRKSNNNIDIDDVILKTQYNITDRDQLSASFHYYNGKAGMPGGLKEQEYAQDPFQSTRPADIFMGQRRDVSVKYKHQQEDKQFELLAYYTNSFRGSNIEQDGITLNPVRSGQFRLRSFPRNYSVYAIEPSYSQRFLTGGLSNEITIGYRLLKEKADEKAYRSKWYKNNQILPLTDYYQHSYGGATAHAAYIDDTIDFGNWTFIPGVRYESINIHSSSEFAKIDRNKQYSEILPSLSMIYRINDFWSLYANGGTSFGSIQYFQLTQGGTGNQTAPGLTAEKARNYELGTRFDNTALRGELTLFYIDFNNQLLLNGQEWTSLGATKHQGIEASVSYDLSELSNNLDGVSLNTTYTYTKAYSVHGVAAGRDLPFYSRQIYTAGARYEINHWDFNVDTYAQSKQYSPNLKNGYDLTPSADGKYGIFPGYMIWNISAGYDFGTKLLNLKLRAGVKNIFNQNYFSRSVDNNFGKYVGEPRTWYMQASLNF